MGLVRSCFFFFQAEDGIRAYKVTGVQTCALPILKRRGQDRAETRTPRGERGVLFQLSVSAPEAAGGEPASFFGFRLGARGFFAALEIGRASCRERAAISVGAEAAVPGRSRTR